MNRHAQITHRWRWFALIGLICGSLLGMLPGILSSAEKPPQILVINSDATVEKYQQAQAAFQESLAQPVLTINLGDPKLKPTQVEDLIYDEDPAVVYCIGSRAYAVANKLAADKMLVFSSIVNWRRLPLTERAYGVSNELPVGMELTLFRYVFPNMQKIGVVYSKTYEDWFRSAQQEARAMGVELLGQKISKKQQVLPAVKKLLPQVDAFWLISDPDVMSEKADLESILAETDRQKIPVLSYHEAFADFGAVLIVSVDEPTIGRQAASIVTDVLADAKLPPEERVQFPAGTRIVLNLKKVKEYGLEYSADALGAITVIIE